MIGYKIAVDVGNTNTKIGLFHNQDLIDVTMFASNKKPALPYSHNFSAAIVSSVSNLGQNWTEFLKASNIQTELLSLDLKLPFKINYSDTLGSDRLANVAGGLVLSDALPILIISVGTCITYDFVSEENVFEGGAISPGPRMRLQAMNTFTSKLPLIEVNTPFNFLATNTNENLLSGAIMGTVFEIEGFISIFKHKNPNLKVFLTGGDAKLLATHIKSKIFAIPNLTLIGLNYILDSIN